MDEGEATVPFKDTFSVTKPQIHEIVSDFRIVKTQVSLNRANITSFASTTIEDCIVDPDQAQLMSTGDEYTSFKYMQDPLIKIVFPEGTELKGSLSDGMEVTVKLNGGLAIGGLGLEAEYSGFDGFRFALLVSQESYLSADVGIAIKQEIRIPIMGIDVSFGIGRVSGGLFLVVGMDGQVTIQIRAREYINSKMGIKGDTFLYVPVSFSPVLNCLTRNSRERSKSMAKSMAISKPVPWFLWKYSAGIWWEPASLLAPGSRSLRQRLIWISSCMDWCRCMSRWQKRRSV